MVIHGNSLESVYGEDVIDGKVVVPDNIVKISDFAFGAVPVKEIILPKSLISIGAHAFASCHMLESINIPENVESIGISAFIHCSNLKSIKLPDKLKTLSESMFESCNNLQNVSLPKNLESIQKNAFSECKSLETLILPDGLKSIGYSAFSKSGIKSIKIPDSVETLGSNSFSVSDLVEIQLPKNIKEIPTEMFFGCALLKSIKIPNNVKKIYSSAFNSCINLRNVELPSELSQIDYASFSNCTNLEKIILPRKLTNLDSYTFANCVNLKSISIPEGISTIDARCFFNCGKLDNVILPNSVKFLNIEVFSGCKNLKTIHMPNSLEKIGANAFKNCTGLEKMELPKNLKTIDHYAFKNCSNLKYISIPNSIEKIEDHIFDNCNNISQIQFPNTLPYLNELGIKQLKYFKKNNNGFTLSITPEKDSFPILSLNINPAVLCFSWKNKDILLNDQKNPQYADVYNLLLPLLNAKQCDEFINSHNFKFLKQFNSFEHDDIDNLDELDIDDRISFYKAMYNLGGFLPSFEQDGKKNNYSQKVSEFFLQKINTEKIDTDDLGVLFEGTQVKGFNKEFTDFFLSNFNEFLKRDTNSDGFISRCYNEFENVQKTNTSHRGSQRQLKPTIEKFVDYFKENKFVGITDETRDIAKTISPYISNQENFNDAVEIYNERKSNNIPTNILGFHLKEENPFEKIDKYKNKIKNIKVAILYNMVETANNEFTYDWLEKNDPQNYILGNLCNCCAHLDGVGFGIMKASMVHKNVQNLVIRNCYNEIIAKSTLYINEKERYGVCNNIEVSNSVKKENYPEIYKKYIKGINDFAENYNKIHKNNPLKIINVGMGFNDLKEELEKNSKQALKILESIDYSKFCNNGFGHPGDSSVCQFVVWENKNQNEFEKE